MILFPLAQKRVNFHWDYALAPLDGECLTQLTDDSDWARAATSMLLYATPSSSSPISSITSFDTKPRAWILQAMGRRFLEEEATGVDSILWARSCWLTWRGKKVPPPHLLASLGQADVSHSAA